MATNNENKPVILKFKRPAYLFLAHTLKNHTQLINMLQIKEDFKQELLQDMDKIRRVLEGAELKGRNFKEEVKDENRISSNTGDIATCVG